MEAVAQYNKEQLTVVSVEGIDHPVRPRSLALFYL
jgi:hypothetical protein